MPALETAIRLIVIGQEVLIAAIFLFGSGGRAARVSGALLMLGIVAYLYTSDSTLRGSLPLIEPGILLLALIAPFCLWLFARAVFEAPWPKPAVTSAVAAVCLLVWGMNLVEQSVDPQLFVAAGSVLKGLALLVVIHALWLTLRGRPDDLIERRRTFRLFFVGIISLQATAVLLVELVLGGASPPAWLDLTNVIIIAVLTLGLAVPLLRLNHEFFEPEAGGDAALVEAEESALGAAERVYHKKLLDLMDTGYYRETGLTIPTLAQRLDYPEHQLRRLINGHLGYRNFSAFLNSYRIRDARGQLGDPESARTPVLTIALNLGYGSLGPFNRAFKESTGTTPTDFRRRKLGEDITDSE